MPTINIYMAQHSPVSQVLAKLLHKASAQGRCLVKAQNTATLTALSQQLWVDRPDSFFPHGVEGDQFAHQQPVWLTTQDDNPNNATMLFLLEDVDSTHLASMDKVAALYDAHAATPQQPTQWQAAGHTINTYQQQADGRWAP